MRRHAGFCALIAVFVVGLLVFEAGAQTPGAITLIMARTPRPRSAGGLSSAPAGPRFGNSGCHGSDRQQALSFANFDSAHPFGRGISMAKFERFVSPPSFRTSQGKSRQGYTPRAATNWQKAPSSCGKGLRIGPWTTCSIKSIPLRRRSTSIVPLERPKLARTSHGTAVTSIIVGRGGWRLLPGAEIVHAIVFHRGKKGPSRQKASSKIDWMIH